MMRGIDFVGMTVEEMKDYGFYLVDEDFDGEGTDIWFNGIFEATVENGICTEID